MNKNSILFVGLDTHKEFNEVVYIEEHRGAQTVHLGRFVFQSGRSKACSPV